MKVEGETVFNYSAEGANNHCESLRYKELLLDATLESVLKEPPTGKALLLVR